MPLGSPPMILETPLSTWGRLANTFSAETQTQRRRSAGPAPAPGPAERGGEESGGSGPVSAGHLLPPPGGAAATLKERRGPRDFLVHSPRQPFGGAGGSTGPGPPLQLWGGVPGPGWPPRAAGRSPACARTPPPRPGTRGAAHAPAAAEGARGEGAHPGGHRATALTDLVRHPRPLVTAPRSPRPSGAARAANQTWPRPSRGKGTERRRRACRTRRGRSEAAAPRSARALPCALPLRTRRTRKRGPARGSPPALTIYSQALGSARRPRRACADLPAPLPPPAPPGRPASGSGVTTGPLEKAARAAFGVRIFPGVGGRGRWNWLV